MGSRTYMITTNELASRAWSASTIVTWLYTARYLAIASGTDEPLGITADPEAADRSTHISCLEALGSSICPHPFD